MSSTSKRRSGIFWFHQPPWIILLVVVLYPFRFPHIIIVVVRLLIPVWWTLICSDVVTQQLVYNNSAQTNQVRTSTIFESICGDLSEQQSTTSFWRRRSLDCGVAPREHSWYRGAVKQHHQFRTQHEWSVLHREMLKRLRVSLRNLRKYCQSPLFLRDDVFLLLFDAFTYSFQFGVFLIYFDWGVYVWRGGVVLKLYLH